MLNLKPKTKRVLMIALIVSIIFPIVLLVGGSLGNGTISISQWDSFGRGLIAAMFIIGYVIEICVLIVYFYEEEVSRE